MSASSESKTVLAAAPPPTTTTVHTRRAKISEYTDEGCKETEEDRIVRFQVRKDICHEVLELLWRDVPYEAIDYNPDCGKGNLIFNSGEMADKYKHRILSGLGMKGRK